MSTFGPVYDRNIDEPTLSDQRNKIRALMLDGRWRTLGEIEVMVLAPQASISAQLRHLRKEQFGGYDVQKRRRSGLRVWEYRIEPPRAAEARNQMLLIPDPKPYMSGH